MNLDTPVFEIPGVGDKISKSLKRLEISTIRDLLWHVPFRYIDATNFTPINQLRGSDIFCIKGKVVSVQKKITPRRRMTIVEAVIEDETGKISATWFNQSYLEKTLRLGGEKIFIGKTSYNWEKKTTGLQSPQVLLKPTILPRYHETYGLASWQIRKIVESTFNNQLQIPEYLPEDLRGRLNLSKREEAFRLIHKPLSIDQISHAKTRLAFDELLRLAVVMNIASDKKTTSKLDIKIDNIKKYVESLPFNLTDAQRKAAWVIINDLKDKKAMQRLLMGDVGSGKTVVAILATLAVINAGKRVLWLVPTEVLAFQHFQTLTNLSGNFFDKIGLLTGSKKEAGPEDSVIVGTHALFNKKEILNDVGLVVVDEQHRFGVAQRAKLKDLLRKTPHFLSMTATPIPRTLALAIYGNLDISVLDEFPAGRQETKTLVYARDDRAKALDILSQEIDRGHQAYVVVPAIEQSEDSDQTLFAFEKKAVITEHKRLEKEFPKYLVEMLHGKMKSKEKQEIMQKFVEGEIQILVSTTVIEVGIDVANATIMMIENAENFGLSQLHQLRGRVGRDKHQSYCLLLSDNVSEKSVSRLKALEKYHSGFKLAEIDLELRGPGALIGLAQSGFPDLKVATLADSLVIKQAKQAAREIIENGIPEPLMEEINHLSQTDHLE